MPASTSSTAASLNPNGHVKINLPCNTSTDPPTCNTIGGPNAPANFSGSGFSPTPVPKDPVPDPLWSIPQCGTGMLGDGTTTTPPPECPTNLITTQAKDLPTNLSPGIYKNGFEGSHSLAPGVYVLMDDIVLNGNDQITGTGVTLFFILSGFVLAWGYKPQQTARSFWWHRIARIYPLHLVGVGLGEQVVVKPHLGVEGVLGGDPVDRALHLAAVRGVPAAGGRVILGA